MTTNEAIVTRNNKLSLFLGLQLIVLAAFASLGAYRSRELLSERRFPPLREEPLTVQPLYDDPAVVTDEQLQRVLLKLRPRLYGAKTIVNYIDHALRLWGPAADFGDPQFVSGEEMRRLLLDHRRFAEVYGEGEPSLLIDKWPGVSFRTQEGNATSAHTDHTIASLAELGTPLSFPVISPAGETTYRALVEQSLRDFSLNQVEYEWSAKTYALFLPPTTTFRTTEGQEVSFDSLAGRAMREALPRGCCLANHRLYTLIVLLRIDQQIPILTPATRTQIETFLTDATRRLVAYQHPDGFWNDEWPLAVPSFREPTQREGDRLEDRVVATGHTLEWWAMAPEKFHPPRAVVVSAAQWLVRLVDGMSAEQIDKNYVFLTHVGKALALWRCREPFDAIRATTAKAPPAAD